VKEIERLIQKLEIDKEILADPINADDLATADPDSGMKEAANGGGLQGIK
jgi:hypothetical protein